MVTIPTPISDVFELANQKVAGTSKPEIPGFNAPLIPSQSGQGITQSRIPNERAGYHTRHMVRWFVPEVGVIEMYVNPQSITYPQKKHITQQRTKGGYVYQYWGEEPVPLSIQGTTGSSGVEGINVLEDIYRAEQVAFDPYALALAAERDAQSNDQFSFLGTFPEDSLGSLLTSAGEGFLDLVGNAIESGNVNVSRPKPTLASLAFSVEMYWSGWVYRGYFSDFRVDERADRLGLFDYTLTFVATQRRGIRQNFMPWHRSAVNGPSNSDPNFGTPYSYTHLGTNAPVFVPPQTDQAGISLSDALDFGAGLVEGVGGALGSIF